MSKNKNTNTLLTVVAHFFGFIATFYLFIINLGFYKYGLVIPNQIWGGTIFQSVVALFIYFDLLRTRRLYAKVETLREEMRELEKVRDEAQKQFEEIQSRQK